MDHFNIDLSLDIRCEGLPGFLMCPYQPMGHGRYGTRHARQESLSSPYGSTCGYVSDVSAMRRDTEEEAAYLNASLALFR